MNLIPYIVVIGIVYAIVRRMSSASSDAETTQRSAYDPFEAERAAEERRSIILEQTRIKEEIRADQERARQMTMRQIEAERQRIAWQKRQDAINRQAKLDRERLRREQERHAAQLAKHEEQNCKMQYQLNQATEDIENIQYKISEQQRYAAFLEAQRDKCVPDGAEYFKWQNKLSAVDDKIYRLDKQRRAAIYRQEQAQRKLA